MLRPFHLAFPVHDLAATRRFWVDVLGCEEGRSAERWIDFDLHGHQVVAHLADRGDPSDGPVHNLVDGDHVPVPHFGVVLDVPAFHALAERVRDAGVEFVVEPHVRFAGEPGEQWTMFFLDPSGNALEFKALADLGQLFAT